MADARKITRRLLGKYPDPGLALRFNTPLELLIATILSAQCTDARVNEVTAALFKTYKRAADYARVRPGTLEKAIKPTGFYRNKARMIINCCKQLDERYNGRVPRSLDALVDLPGVGRKTANMVLGNAFGMPAIAVDTHVLRVSNRLGLAATHNAVKAEQALMERIPREQWTPFTNAMILHGRDTCTARKPRCCQCIVYDLCEWPDKPACP